MIRLALLIAFCLAVQPIEAADGKRQIIFLDGTWSVQRGGTDLPADAPQGKVPVPGLADMVTDADGYHPDNKSAPVMGRYVRVTATKAANPGSGIAMTELEVYPPSGTP